MKYKLNNITTSKNNSELYTLHYTSIEDNFTIDVTSEKIQLEYRLSEGTKQQIIDWYFPELLVEAFFGKRGKVNETYRQFKQTIETPEYLNSLTN